MLFNLYAMDQLRTNRRKLIYVGYLALGYQSIGLKSLEYSLTSDLNALHSTTTLYLHITSTINNKRLN